MRSAPHGPAVQHHYRLRGFVLNPEPRCDGARHIAIFDHENQAAGYVAGPSREARELFVGFGADRALRAMLENENGIGFRFVEKLFEIFAFP